MSKEDRKQKVQKIFQQMLHEKSQRKPEGLISSEIVSSGTPAIIKHHFKNKESAEKYMKHYLAKNQEGVQIEIEKTDVIALID